MTATENRLDARVCGAAVSNGAPLATPARHFAVVPAAGIGARMGADRPKQYLALQGASLLEHTVRALLADPVFACVLVVVAPGDTLAQTLPGLNDARVKVAAVGGATRRDSVLGGLDALAAECAAGANDWVWVHDAARPGIDPSALKRLHDALVDEPVGAVLALPVADTVKRAQAMASDGAPVRLQATLPRDGLWLAQTPQVFRFAMLREALIRHPAVTDEAGAIEAQGLAPRLVPGSRRNTKVTTMDDLQTLRGDDGGGLSLRIGQGWDVHALVPGRALVIGGVTIPSPRGLLGHSDADVLLHAITDALLGAAGLGDIGRHFPDTDPAFAGADSRQLLRETMRRVAAAGWAVGNIDATVVAQSPRLAPHLPAMVAAIAADLGVSPGSVNVKAKTSEKLGFAGRGEGIEAHAVALLRRGR
jgi:2-C-methyl-D-erythritol 4-phosphate cytidylyltransferase/2-C-methyl-D-erythritol 2,4-cyclodiphosphate synthase